MSEDCPVRRRREAPNGRRARLVRALVPSGFEEWERRLAEAVAAPTARGRIENALRAYREFALERPRHFELMFLVPRPGVPLAPESLRTTPSPSFAAMIAAVHVSMANGDLVAADPGQIILMVWALTASRAALHRTLWIRRGALPPEI